MERIQTHTLEVSNDRQLFWTEAGTMELILSAGKYVTWISEKKEILMVVEELGDVLSTRNLQGKAMPSPPQVSGVLNCLRHPTVFG